MKMIINGLRANAQSGRTFDNVNPFNGEPICTMPLSDKPDYEIAVQAARKAQPEWAQTSMSERVGIIDRFVGLVKKEFDDIVSVMVAEGGKVASEAKSELNSFCAVFESCVEEARHFYGSTTSAGGPLYSRNDTVFIEREPLGVFFVFTPFNFPVEMLAYRAAPALIAGNAVIVKPRTETPQSAVMLTQLLHQAGLPAGVLQCLTGDDTAAFNWLKDTDEIDAVFYSGTYSEGRRLVRERARRPQRAFITAAGNCSSVVLDTADIEFAVEQAVRSRTYNAGQSFYTGKRFIVHSSIHDEFVDQLAYALKKLKLGNPAEVSTDMGPLVSESAAQLVNAQIVKTVSQGAELIAGGEKSASFITPAILTGVTAGMDIAGDMEVCGPVFPIIKFSDVGEALRLVNTRNYGSICWLFSKNIGAAMKFATKVYSEDCIINGGSFASVQLPGTDDKYLELGVKSFDCSFIDVTKEKKIVLNPVLPLL